MLKMCIWLFNRDRINFDKIISFSKLFIMCSFVTVLSLGTEFVKSAPSQVFKRFFSETLHKYWRKIENAYKYSRLSLSHEIMKCVY